MSIKTVSVIIGGAGAMLAGPQFASAAFAPPRSWDFEDYATPFSIVNSPSAAAPFNDWRAMNTVMSPTVLADGTANSGTKAVLIANPSATDLGGLRLNNTMASRHGMDVSLQVNFPTGSLVNLAGDRVNFEVYVTNTAAVRAGKVIIDAKADNTVDLIWEHGDSTKGTSLLGNLAVSALEGQWNKIQIKVDLDPFNSMTTSLPLPYDGSGDPSAYEVRLNDAPLGAGELFASAAIMPGGASGNWVQDVFIGVRGGSVYVDDISVASPQQLSIPEPAGVALLGLGGLGVTLRRRRST